ncbi:MAG: sulfatase [Saprospiraceae bacterium]|nr:sulfatase [Saprospiraceae bacterium]
MSILRLFLVLNLFWSSITFADGQSQAQKPNVVMIVLDDMNDWTTLFDENNPIRVPNIKELASRGAFFTKAYASSPACNPSRASVMTGLRPHKTGVYGNSSDWRSATPGHPTIQQLFKDNGYYTAGSGKIFHHHNDWAFHDNAAFNEFLMMNINEPYPPKKLNGLDDYGSRNTDWGIWPPQIEQTADFKTMEYAKAFLAKDHESPFFLNLGIYKPHSPFFAPAPYFEEYPSSSLTMPILLEKDETDLPAGAKEMLLDSDWFWTGMQASLHKKPQAWRDYVRAYQACASFADDMVGRIMKALEESKYASNTIIILWSDHGFHLGEKNHFEKFALWEKTTHVPFIVIAPGITSPGMIIDTPIDLTAIYPGIAELCGITTPEVDGKSFVQLLRNKSSDIGPALQTYGKGNHALRTERWRYIRYNDGSEELYDHESDPNEWNNLANGLKYRPIMDSLQQFLPRTSADQVPDLIK